MHINVLLSGCFYDNDVIFRYVTMSGVSACRYCGDSIHYIHALSHFTKYTVAPALVGRCRMIKKSVIFVIDEKLRRR